MAADYSQLARPEVGASVNLTEAQRATIQQLIQERDAASAAAEETARPAIVAATNEKLKDVLTSDQQRFFLAFFNGKLLRFNFRNQKWAEVLDWVAKEADLSLVMETSPPGTFNYTDSKDYTATESLDLLNGWLLTKGFTLVRRERMLMCLDLKGGLPEGAVPRVTVAELATRGRYEFVSVLLPLEGRVVDAVLLEVKPLLGSYGKAEPLAQTQQLLVYDTASSLRLIEQVVQKIPIPDKPVLPPVLTVYPIRHANPTQASEVLRTIVAGTVVADEKAMQISVNASPAEQEKAKIILEQLESNQGPDMQPRLQLYSVQVTDADQMLATLKLIAPEGQYRIDPLSGKLIAWASEKDQARIAESLKMIQAEQPEGAGRQLQVYALTNADPTAVTTILLSVTPSARVTVNAATRSLVAYGTISEHEAIRSLIEQLENQTEPASSEKVLRTYPATATVATSVVTLLATAVPKAQVLSDTANQRLLVMATADEHAQIELLLQSMATAETDGRQLKIYQAERIDTVSVVGLLATLAPQAAITVDALNKRLLVVAADAEHLKVAAVLEQVQTAEIDAMRPLKAYPLQPRVTTATIVTLLATLVPKASVTPDEANRRILIAATEKEHALIEQVITQVQQEAVGVKPELKFYDVSSIGATDARTLLTATYTDVTFVVTADGTKLMAWVLVEQDLKIKATLEQLAKERPFENTRTLQLYSITDLGPASSTVLAQAVPKATITAGARADQLAIVATAAEHEKLKQVLEQLQAAKTVPQARVLAVHQIKGITPSSVLQVLQPLVDADVQLTIDPVGQQLFVRAFPDKQEQIKTVVEQVTASLASKAPRVIKTYIIGAPNADEAQEVLLALFPDAKIVIDSDRKMIVATATEEQHVTIAQISEQMRGMAMDGERPYPAVYALKNSSATEVQTLLLSMYSRFDNVRLSVNEKTGRLVVLARKEQHDSIRSVLDEFDGKAEPVAKQELAVFRLRQMDGYAVQQALAPLLPKTAQVTADRIGRQLFVSAPADEMPAIREMVQQMMSSQSATEGLETRTYRLRPFEADEAQEVLARLFPDATLVTDQSQEILVATATVLQHETIAKVVQQMTSVAPIENTPKAVAYTLRAVDGDNVVEVFDGMFRRSDNVRMTFDSQTRSLMVVARPDQQEMVKTLLAQMEPDSGTEIVRSMEIYPLSGMDGLTAVEVAKGVLRTLDPSASVSWERASKQLIVSTTAAGQQEVGRAFERFLESDPREMDVLQLRTLSASSAQNAIEGLYGDSFAKDGNYPLIQADEDLQQLLVRGTKKQLQDIRTLLIKMGESGLAVAATGENTNRNLRVIPIQGDVEPALQKIQDLWPRVRKNPIRVLRPNAAMEPLDPASNPEPAVKTGGQFSVPAESLSLDEPPTQTAITQANTQEDAAAVPTQNPLDEPAAIVVIPGLDRVTIASDDVEALDQLEAILRATSSRPTGAMGNRNRDFSIYQLRNAGAEEVSETLESIYQSRAGLLAFGSVVIVPEPRMNALIVYGGRTDRDRIEQLLEILDTEKLPDSGRIFRTQVIVVKHADAEKVQTVLRGVYRTEMNAGGTRRPITIPAGIDSSVASVLRQMNAAASAPLLTIEVQTETNSLVIKAPQSLIDELSELVTQLDDTTATNRARGVTLFPLKQTNTRRVMRVLNDVLE